MPRHYPRQWRKPALPAERNRDREYIILKEAWKARHPESTPAEYESAMVRIARELGL